MLAHLLVVPLFTQVAGLAYEDRVQLKVFRGQGVEACPDDAALSARVRDRIGSEPFREPDDVTRAREVRVGIAGDAAGLQARVVLFSPAGAKLGRRVLRGAADCVQLADELVLALAIAIDPLLLVRRRPPREPTPAPVIPPRAFRPARPPAASMPPPAGGTVRGLLSVSSGAGVVAAPSVRGEVSLDYGALDLDAGLRFDLPARYPVSDAALLDVTLVALHAAPCLGWTREITTLRACGVAEAGAFVVQSVGLAGARSVTTPWLAVGGRGAVDLQLWPALALVVSGELLAPLVRPRFVDDVSGRVYAEAGPVTAQLGVGLALQIR